MLSPFFYPQLADVESSPSKEEDEDDDDTMQNTVVLFSNTDKFVLMQVTGALREGQMDRTAQNSVLPPTLAPCPGSSYGLSSPGHVRGVRQLRARGRGAPPRLLPVLPVLPPLLRQQQGEGNWDPWPRVGWAGLCCIPQGTHTAGPFPLGHMHGVVPSVSL